MPSLQHQFAVDELRALLRDALQRADRTELHVLTAAATAISSPLRTGLIPEVLVIDIPPFGAASTWRR
ncbi:hypothetical protein [Kutzneria buriramensis]|uniref:Uncharacterized protein n=1 Tax=Kutzneria buriramensis TaxID=1045776 RepID=A0A3E0HV06_9PSEU|nr:hypothetical protein [Kutzneria buriramensis]REH50297.1 hypothetical protein BCF44_104574 [Kutzneria buriramensis]